MRGWFDKGAHEKRKRMEKLQQRRIANRERNTQNQEDRPLWEEELDRQLADFHMVGNVEGEINLNQVADPQLLPLFPNQPIELEKNQEDQFPNPAFDPNEISRIPAPGPLVYDPSWDDHRSFQEI
ncbi:hypothetical protein Hanom_Chr09g00793811 [Helianthus anomalus]